MASHIHDASPFTGEPEDRIPAWWSVSVLMIAAIASFVVTVLITVRMRPW